MRYLQETATDNLTKLRRKRSLASLLCSIFVLGSASINYALAADISAEGSEKSGIIKLSGPIEPGDSEKLRTMAERFESATVELNSPGGLVREGLAIGTYIRERKFNTTVGRNGTCASACGLIWLAGAKKSVGGGGRVGFHAAYLPTKEFSISSTGNALVGAYLSKLSLSDIVVVYVTEAAPRDMRWLTSKDAKFLSIPVTWSGEPLKPADRALMTEADVRKALQASEWFSAAERRFPKFYEFVVNETLKAQQFGESSEIVLSRAVFTSPEAQVFTDALLAQADSKIILSSLRTQLRVLKALQRRDPSMCAAIAWPGEFELDVPSYLRATDGDLRGLSDELASLKRTALLSPPVNAKALTKKEIARYQTTARKKMRTLFKVFKRHELERIFSGRTPQRRDAELFCRYGIATLEVAAQNPELAIALTRHPEVFDLR